MEARPRQVPSKLPPCRRFGGDDRGVVVPLVDLGHDGSSRLYHRWRMRLAGRARASAELAWWAWPIMSPFFVLFLHSRLFADMWLQVVYFALGVYGWWHWCFGGAQRSTLSISRARTFEWMGLLLFIPLVTWGLRVWLTAVNGAAPFWDSATTVLSLAAQYLLCQKRIENWWIWIVADIIYVPFTSAASFRCAHSRCSTECCWRCA